MSGYEYTESGSRRQLSEEEKLARATREAEAERRRLDEQEAQGMYLFGFGLIVGLLSIVPLYHGLAWQAGAVAALGVFAMLLGLRRFLP